MKTLLFLLILLPFSLLYSQTYSKDQLDSIKWAQPPEIRDTVVTYTIAANKKQYWIIDGDTVATLDANQIAARRRISSDKKYWVSVSELDHNIQTITQDIEDNLLIIAKNDNNFTNAQIGQLAKDQYKRLRQYSKTVKVANVPIE